MSKYFQGKFTPTNPQKYKGDPTGIIFRSSWEAAVMRQFDLRDDVVEWSSEEIIVPYRSPIDGNVHRYYVDFFAKMRDKNGNVHSFLIEVKPDAQTRPPAPQKKATKRYINEVQTWGVNEAKWIAARAYCAKNNMTFQILTEKHLNVK